MVDRREHRPRRSLLAVPTSVLGISNQKVHRMEKITEIIWHEEDRYIATLKGYDRNPRKITPAQDRRYTNLSPAPAQQSSPLKLRDAIATR